MKTHLTLSGPFLTTKILDPQRLGGTNGNIGQLRAAYAGVQSHLGKCLANVDRGWTVSGASLEADTDYDGKSYTGSAIFPEFLAQCALSSVEVAEVVTRWTAEPHADKFSEGSVSGIRVQSGTITFVSCRVSVHDFGVGIVEIDLRWDGFDKQIPSDVRDEIEALTTSFATLSSMLAGRKLQQFINCLENFPEIGAAFTTMSPGTSGQYNATRPKVLWIHRIYAVTSENWTGTSDDLADQMLARHHVHTCENASINPAVCLYPSIGGSLAFLKEPQGDDSLAFLEPLKCAISLQNAYNAAIWMFDDILFGRTVELMGEQDQIVSDNVKLEGLMIHAHSILRLSSYISTFLSVLHNRTSRSSPQQMILTEKIYHAWRMELQREALENKLAVLKEMYQVTLRLLADAEARSLNKLVFAFTLLSLVTVITTVADFSAKLEEFHGFSLWRTSLVIGSAALVVIVAFGVRMLRHRWALRGLNTDEEFSGNAKIGPSLRLKGGD